MERTELIGYLDDYLEVSLFNDPGINGLQVEGCSEIQRIVCGVSVSLQLIEQAAELDADTILVHHGLLWKNGDPRIIGAFRKRIAGLLAGEINLIAYHLPLDAHAEVGNNFVAARRFGMRDCKPFARYHGREIGVCGVIDPVSPTEFRNRVRDVYHTEPLYFPYGPDLIRRVGIVSGGAAGDVVQAVEQGLDLFVTGESEEWTLHYARESQIHFAAAGHYASETFGIQALAEHLRTRFTVDIRYLDIPNPV